MTSNRMDPSVRWSCVAVGILVSLCGLGLLVIPAMVPSLAALVIGMLLVLAGGGEVLYAVVERGRGWGLSVLVGIVSMVAGALLLADPAGSGVRLAYLIAGYMVVAGPVKILLAVLWRPIAGWRWMLFNGVLTVGLGLILLNGWPETARWALGVFFGLDMLTAGIALTVHGIGGVSVFGAREDQMLPS